MRDFFTRLWRWLVRATALPVCVRCGGRMDSEASAYTDDHCMTCHEDRLDALGNWRITGSS